MEHGLELGATAIDNIADKHGEKIYDAVAYSKWNPFSSSTNKEDSSGNNNTSFDKEQASEKGTNSSSKSSSRREPRRHRHRAELPSPERETLRDDYNNNNDHVSNHDNNDYSRYRSSTGDRSFEQQSTTSDQVLRSYEHERDDSSKQSAAATSSASYSRQSDNYQTDRPYYHNHRPSKDMSYDYDNRRPSSQQPPARSRYYEDDEYGSDYDERNGRRTRTTGRGYDPETGGEYDREIVETERYRGPPRDWGNQRSSSFQDNNDYAVAQYNRSSADLAAYDAKRRSRSRGRRSGDGRYYEDDREYDRDNGHHEHKDLRDRLENTFDTSPRGIGVGIAGALVGGLAGRSLGSKQHSKRDMVIGALIGGLGANAAEQKWHDWKVERDFERDEDNKYDNRDSRSRSAMR